MRRFLIEADGGARGNPGPASFGAVVRDADTGEVLVEIADHLGTATNNVAEYSALIAGLTEAVALDPHCEIAVRMDSKLVVEQMRGSWAIKHPAMRELALQARSAVDPSKVSYEWIPRKSNAAADALVNESLDAVASGLPGRIRRLRTGEVEADDVVGEALEARAVGTARAAAGRPAPNRIVGWEPDLGPPTTLLLLRHGATDMTLARVFSGSGGRDAPLAPVGRDQAAAAAAEIVARGGVDAIVASPLRRALETADVIAAEVGVAIEVDDGVAECGFGDWDGLTFAEVRERWPVELEAWLASPHVAPPGGESMAECRARVEAARGRLVTGYAGLRVVVVSHVTPIKMAVGIALDAPVHSLYRMELAPCSLTTVSWWSDGNASLLGFAESAHLRGVGVGPGA